MKKILLIVGIAFGCSSVYAQTVDQNGDNNQLTADQSAKTNPLTAYDLKQYMGNNIAEIRQGADVNIPGKQNLTTIRQVSIGVTALNLRNWVKVDQEGGSNRINADQYGRNNRAQLTQTFNTTGSQIITSQSGYNNGILVEQTNGSGYIANIRQGASIPGAAFVSPGASGALPNTRFNTASLKQTGFGGTATVIQEGSSGIFIGEQAGGDLAINTIDVVMDNKAGSEVYQAGNNNQAITRQRGFQYSKITQKSSNPEIIDEPVNSVAVVRQGLNTLDDSRNSAFITQETGDGNYTEVNQNNTASSRNTAMVKQQGTREGAQNSTVVINQESKSSTVDVVQSMNGSGNRASFTQRNSELMMGSNARLDQGGKLNQFTAVQDGKSNNIGGVIGDAASRATQKGVGNVATNITQTGRNNKIAFDQDGAGNTININQVNDLASGIGNKATAKQGSSSSNGTITITQTVIAGDENEAIVEQTKGDQNQATVNQYEMDYAKVTQSGTDDAGNTSTVSVDQSVGTSARATVTQADGTRGGDVVVVQRAVGNETTVDQLKGRQNYASVYQTDDNNSAILTQSGTIDITGAISQIYVNQTGKGGKVLEASQADGTSGGIITIDQSKIGNTATVKQTAGRQNNADIDQTDDNNTATVTQSGTVDGAATTSRVIVTQGGKSGEATITQSANGSLAQVIQYAGDRNKVIELTQSGRLNTAIAEQAGDDNEATLIQSGDNNVIRTLQSGIVPFTQNADNITKVTQGGTANDAVTAQGGINNNAEIRQPGGRDNFAVSVQYGTDNKATANQSATGKLNSATILQLRTNAPAATGAFGSTDANTVRNTISGGTYDGSTIQQVEDNVATVNQTDGPTNKGENNVAVVLQTGDNETLTLNQNNTDNTAALLQAGEHDQMTITQNGSFGIAVAAQYGQDGQAGNIATEITQAGDRNAMVFVQGGYNNTTKIDQKGTENGVVPASGIVGGIISAQYGQRNTIDIKQNSERSFVAVGQGNASFAPAPSIDLVDLTGFVQVFDNNAMVTQTGRRNIAIVGQQGDEGTKAMVTQGGENNIVGLLQLNVGSTGVISKPNTAEIEQRSDVSNSSIIVAQQGGKNDATARQFAGRLNAITLIQSLDENSATLLQYGGNSNVIGVTQGVDPGRKGNTVKITQQVGEGNVALLAQSGYENELTLTQNGDRNQLRLLAAGSVATQGGNNNDAILSQTGQDHIINFNQSGMNNMATITQTNLLP